MRSDGPSASTFEAIEEAYSSLTKWIDSSLDQYRVSLPSSGRSGFSSFPWVSRGPEKTAFVLLCCASVVVQLGTYVARTRPTGVF